MHNTISNNGYHFQNSIHLNSGRVSVLSILNLLILLLGILIISLILVIG
jgi:subtilase family serine protease